MIDDEVGAHTRVTVLVYWKFESVSLQQTVSPLVGFLLSVSKSRHLPQRMRARPGGMVGRDTQLVNITPIAGNVSVGPYSSTAAPLCR